MFNVKAIIIPATLGRIPVAVSCPKLEQTSVGYLPVTIQVGDSEPFTRDIFVAQKGRTLAIDYWNLHKAIASGHTLERGFTLVEGAGLRLASGKDRLDESASLVPLEDEVVDVD